MGDRVVKTGVRDRAQAVRYAITNVLVASE
jgi:hypothetical protein